MYILLCRLRMKPKSDGSSSPENIQTPSLHLLTMAPPKLVARAVASTAADAAHAELSKLVDSRNPDIVDRRPDEDCSFEGYLKTIDLQKTNALAIDFLGVGSVSKEFSLSIFVLFYLRGYRM
jgi:hypothetical protein